jgi:hypothetical protein
VIESTLAGCAKVLFSETRLAAAYCIIIAPLCKPIAFALDHLKLGVSELANVSERRLERLVNPQLNGINTRWMR